MLNMGFWSEQTEELMEISVSPAHKMIEDAIHFYSMNIQSDLLEIM
jgi:hypothetical protein